MSTTDTPQDPVAESVKYGWMWFFPEEDPDGTGNAWIEIGPLDEEGDLSGDMLCEILCRNYAKVKAEHPEWIEAKERDATLIVEALNIRQIIVDLKLHWGIDIAAILGSVADQLGEEPRRHE